MYLKEFKLLPSLLLLVILPMIATDIYLPVIPQMGREFEAAGSGLANTLSAYMLGYSLSLLAAGIFADIYGRRVVAIIGLTIFFLSSIGCFFAATVDQLIIWRFFQAFGGGCGTLIARIIVRDAYDLKAQVKVLSYLAMGIVASPILGPTLGAYISDVFGWRSIFLFLACFSLFAVIFLCLYLHETLPNANSDMQYRFKEIFLRCCKLWTNREFVFNTLVISFAWGVYFTFISSSPFLIQTLYQFEPVEYGYIFSATISGFILGAIFIRWKIAILDLRELIFLAGAIVFFSAFSLFIFIILGGKSLGALLFFVFLALFGIGIIFPATQAGVTIPFKKDLGLISGVFYSTEMFFGAICGYVISCMDVINWYGSSLVMLVASTCILFLLVLDKSLSKAFQNKVFEKI